MALTVDWPNRIVDSSTSILDLAAARAELRALESSDTGMLYPSIITYKEIDLGNGAKFLAVDFVHSFRLRFLVPGNYTIKGNLGATLVPVAGVYVERQTSAAYATTSADGAATGGLTSDQAAMLLALAKIHGLVLGSPLVVTPASRSAGDVVQTITEGVDSVTVART